MDRGASSTLTLFDLTDKYMAVQLTNNEWFNPVKTDATRRVIVRIDPLFGYVESEQRAS